ncbi:tetratricopeptide repeat protein [Streptomyces sp. NPDC055692]|uniref:tetratricopeptide repeat protein n=1 Tax=Streptomyces sp. NPDC055692 TaxID=3155683 RepID=UPI003417740A
MLLVGDPTSGKSRTAFEVAKGKFPDHRVFRPEDGAEFGECVSLADSNSKVIWLDDLDRFLSPPFLSVGLLDEALQAGVVLIGTMRADRLDMLSPRHERGLNQETRMLVRSARSITARAHVLYLDRQWNAEEVKRARRSGDFRVKEAAQHSEEYGIAEYLAAGPQLYLEWKSAWAPGLHPRGAALVSAAVDLRRAGIEEPISRQLLERLHEHYLEQRGGMRLRPEPLLDAFHWALEPLHATSSLLVPVADDMYRAFDYLAGAVARDGKVSVPLDEVWASAIEDFPLEVVHAVGHRAEKASKHDFALRAYGRLAHSGNRDGSFHLAQIASKQDRLEEAELWYRKAVSQGSPISKNNLGLVLMRSGRPDEAESWFREAARDGDPYGARNLGEYLFDREKWDEAKEFFLSFMKNSPSVAKLLMGQLGLRRGEYKEAEDWLQQAVEEGNNDAWFFLGVAQEKLKDWTSASSSYERAAKVGSKEAPNNLASALRKLGRIEEAEALYRDAIEQGDEYALFNLANLLAEAGRYEEAEPLYRQSVNKGSEHAKNNLALVLENLGKDEEAEQLFLSAADDGDMRAMANLATRCRQGGRPGEALSWINRALPSGNPGYYVEMGLIQETLGAFNKAMLWYRRAIDSGLSSAAVTLGYLYERQGKNKAAQKLYSKAAKDGESHALYHLGQYYLSRKDLSRAYVYLHQAREAGENVFHMLAYLAIRAGDLVEARELLDQADPDEPQVLSLRQWLDDVEERTRAAGNRGRVL